MHSLVEKFDSPIPDWLPEIKIETQRKFNDAPFSEMVQGKNGLPCDIAILRRLFLSFWPFVNPFPDMVASGVSALRHKLFLRHGPALVLLFLKAKKILAAIESDEKEHRDLWLEACDYLGIEKTLLALELKKPLPEVSRLIEMAQDSSDFSLLMARCVGVEHVAECVSRSFLSSERLKNYLGTAGCGWFNAHLEHHQGMTHEELAFRLAVAFNDGKYDLMAAITEVTDTFIAGAESCRRLVHGAAG